ncbi:selenoB, glycine/betaine/sarcosine/D-proline reductase family protein [Clostridioides difficile CD86]|nr:selenoB, glycine/betaine/sarcosine/D-proline reductase family protein [Clostridioides difficile CD86]
MSKIRVVHYINNFFAGIGGEEKADIPPEKRAGVVGPGIAFQSQFNDDAEIISTVICGDTYFGENIESATQELLKMIKEESPDLFIAGPAFNAGRYGVACGTICKAVEEELNIPVITGMYKENPGVDMFKLDLHIVSTGNSAASLER